MLLVNHALSLRCVHDHTRVARNTLSGTPVVPGVAAGPVLHVRGEVSPDAIARFGDGDFPDADAALAAYDDAVGRGRGDLLHQGGRPRRARRPRCSPRAPGWRRDKGLRSGVAKNLQAGQGPVAAVQGAVEQFVTIFTNMGGLMAERVTDLRDIERRVVAHLVGEPAPGVPTPSEPSILVAEDLAPSDTSGLDPELVTALVTERGGATSHTAIIARQLGIPCVVGAAGVMELPAGTFVVVDGEAGTIEQGADPDAARSRVEESRRLREELASWSGPAATADGLPVKLLANVADGASAALRG